VCVLVSGYIAKSNRGGEEQYILCTGFDSDTGDTILDVELSYGFPLRKSIDNPRAFMVSCDDDYDAVSSELTRIEYVKYIQSWQFVVNWLLWAGLVYLLIKKVPYRKK
jgi:hypothetical protein